MLRHEMFRQIINHERRLIVIKMGAMFSEKNFELF